MITEAVVQRCSVKKVFFKISQNSQENTCTRVSFLTKLQAWNFIKKETLAQVFSCEFCEISINTFSYRTPLMNASVIRKLRRNEIWKLISSKQKMRAFQLIRISFFSNEYWKVPIRQRNKPFARLKFAEWRSTLKGTGHLSP